MTLSKTKTCFFMTILWISASSGVRTCASQISVFPRDFELKTNLLPNTNNYLQFLGLTIGIGATYGIVNTLDRWQTNANNNNNNPSLIGGGGIDLLMLLAGLILITKSSAIANYFSSVPQTPSKPLLVLPILQGPTFLNPNLFSRK